MTETALLVILLVALAEVIKKHKKNNRPTLYFRTVITPDKIGQPL